LVTQLCPSLVFILMKRNFVTKQGAAAGIIAGVSMVAYVTISNTTIGTLFPLLPQSIQDLNQGIIALLINLVVMTIVSLITKDNVSIDDRQSRVA
ncbi:sodium:solute symporter family protein, partial [Bacillus sp. SIMBA_074]